MLHDRVPAERHKMVARSLNVETARHYYLIRWRDRIGMHEYSIPKSDLSFYRRGDIDGPMMGSPCDDRRNEEVASAFAHLAFELEPADIAPERASLFIRVYPVALGSLAILGCMSVIGKQGVWLLCVLLAGMMAVEFIHGKGKISLPAFGIAIAAVGFPYVSGLVNTSLAVISFLEPDHRLRRLRVNAHLGVVMVSIWLIVSGEKTPSVGWPLAAAGLAAMTIIAIRSLYGTHFRFYPLIFPVACIGLMMDGDFLSGAVGLLGAMLGVVCLNVLNHAWPAQGKQ